MDGRVGRKERKHPVGKRRRFFSALGMDSMMVLFSSQPFHPSVTSFLIWTRTIKKERWISQMAGGQVPASF